MAAQVRGCFLGEEPAEYSGEEKVRWSDAVVLGLDQYQLPPKGHPRNCVDLARLAVMFRWDF